MNKTQQFIDRAIAKHGDKYDYSKSVYTKINSKVTIICKKHGEFTQSAYSHLSGRNCVKCVNDYQRNDSAEFFKKCSDVHNNRYDYSKSIYKSVHDKITIICHEHGEFQQEAKDHRNGNNCPKCKLNFAKNDCEDFFDRCKIIHNNKYDYSKSIYSSVHDKMIIVCETHGEFEQKANDHVRGHGCPKCSAVVSRPHQKLIDFIKSIYNKEILINDRQTINPFEIDIYLPDVKIGIEVNGIRYHSYGQIESKKQKFKHFDKHSLCEHNDIKLLGFKCIEINNNTKFEIIKSIIRSKLSLSNRIFARKCIVKKIPNKDCVDFFNINHMQGFRPASVSYGLYYNDVLMSAMSFSRHNKHQWEIMRYATILNNNVIGGASKLFMKFLIEHNPDTILTFADRRYATGNVYKQLGFKFDTITKPNYVYWKSGDMELSRQKCQKHKLNKLLDVFDSTKSEPFNMFNNGYRRYWDCGNFKFLWEKQ